MQWPILAVLVSVLSTGLSINRPVYKIVLRQKGFTQFVQYEIETPPIREFTFCTWIRIYDFGRDQSIFSYVANGNHRILRMWMDSGGQNLFVSVNGRASSTTPIELTKDVWRHICLSYQSDYGAWATYMDSRLISCQSSHEVVDFVLPEGGSIIVGYGSNDNGVPSGLHGEIFGANMILLSTIERNHTLKNNPSFIQRRFRANKIKSGNPNAKYIILDDLETGNNRNSFETTPLPGGMGGSRSFIKVNLDLLDKAFPFSRAQDAVSTTESDYDINFWNLNRPDQRTHIQSNKSIVAHLNNSLSEYETPPPPPSFLHVLESNYEKLDTKTKNSDNFSEDFPSEFETPPPASSDTNVYGQWTSSKFAGSVLNYLKSIKLHTRERKKVPQTIPLKKLSDSFPYASNLKLTKLRPPLQFQRRNLIERFDNNKRTPKINVEILENDFRTEIIKSHAQTETKNVDITNRGNAEHNKEHRFYRAAKYQESEEKFKSSEFSPDRNEINENINNPVTNTNNFMSILPFLKSLEYFTEPTRLTRKSHDMYSKALSDLKKWNDIKIYNKPYEPRGTQSELTPESTEPTEVKKKPSHIRLKYKHEDRKVVKFTDDKAILEGRDLAMEVSNQSETIKDPLTLVKYNHGYLPGRDGKYNILGVNNSKGSKYAVKNNSKNSFHRNIKIGNALNERQIIGVNKEQNRQSFIGGDEAVPDINRYRSDLDDEIELAVPASLTPKVCKYIDWEDPRLYVLPDENIDVTHIPSPIRLKNIGIEFIMQNYKKCSLHESELESHPMLFIDWSRTPVRLFGGAYPIRTTDLCGFFK